MAALSAGHLATDFANGALPALLPFMVDRFDLSYTLAAALMLASAARTSGTNVTSPNQATLRNAITPRSSARAPGRSSPVSVRLACGSGAKLERNGTAVSSSTATARPGSASKRPPVSPSASTSGVVAVGPSA